MWCWPPLPPFCFVDWGILKLLLFFFFFFFFFFCWLDLWFLLAFDGEEQKGNECQEGKA